MNTKSSISSNLNLPILAAKDPGCILPIIAMPIANESDGVREPAIESSIDKINRLLQSYGHGGVFMIKGADRLGARKCWQQSP